MGAIDTYVNVLLAASGKGQRPMRLAIRMSWKELNDRGIDQPRSHHVQKQHRIQLLVYAGQLSAVDDQAEECMPRWGWDLGPDT